jgi:hypothetical protein
VKMSLEQWLRNNWLARHEPTVAEIGQLLAVVRRELADAGLPGLSADAKFMHAYQAALQLCKTALLASGYEVHRESAGHHHHAINSLKFTLGQEQGRTAVFLTQCSRLRSRGMYEQVGIADERTAGELLGTARQLLSAVGQWLRKAHPALLPPGAGFPEDK